MKRKKFASGASANWATRACGARREVRTPTNQSQFYDESEEEAVLTRLSRGFRGESAFALRTEQVSEDLITYVSARNAVRVGFLTGRLDGLAQLVYFRQ